MQKARIIGKLRDCFKAKGFAFNFWTYARRNRKLN
jgi:hypothetical protein